MTNEQMTISNAMNVLGKAILPTYDASDCVRAVLREVYRAGRLAQALENNQKPSHLKPAHWRTVGSASIPCLGCDRCDGHNWR